MPSIVIAQGGGPTAVINQTLCGAILAARGHDPSLRILGARYGVRGLTAGNVVDLTGIPEAQLRRLGNTPNSALGSTRDKPDSPACADILSALERFDARAFVYIGGNDTAGTLELLRQQSSGACHFVHAPKTIDNDLMENDHVPGFISAATFVANALVSMDLDFRAMPGIYVAIVMGRHAGFLAAAAAGWQQSPDDAPHLIYTPERPFSVVQFLGRCRLCAAGSLHRLDVRGSAGRSRPASRRGAGGCGGRARRPWQSPINGRRSRHRDPEGTEIAFSQGEGARRYARLSAARIYRRDRRNRPQGGFRRRRICGAKRLDWQRLGGAAL